MYVKCNVAIEYIKSKVPKNLDRCSQKTAGYLDPFKKSQFVTEHHKHNTELLANKPQDSGINLTWDFQTVSNLVFPQVIKFLEAVLNRRKENAENL